MFSQRILTILFGLFIGYLAIYFGDGIRLWMEVYVYPAQLTLSGAIGVIAGGLIFVGAVVGILLWTEFMHRSLLVWSNVNDTESTAVAALVFILLACVFGVVAAPFSNYGPYPWHWASRWDVELALALMPLVVVLHGIVVDLYSAAHDTKKE